MTVLEANGIAVSFGEVKALQGVDLRVDAGEVVGIIGANGAGKTTLFDCLSGITDCEGTVLVDGADVSQSAVHERARAGLGRSFQDARLFHSMTCWTRSGSAASGTVRRAPRCSARCSAARPPPDGKEVATAARRSWTRSSGSGATGTSWSVSSRQGPGGSSTSPACSSSDPRWCCSTSRRPGSRSARPSSSRPCC